MKKSWNDRINDAKQEKATAEDTTHGCYVELFMRDFFISDEVIPEHCKIYIGGRVKKYNFSEIDLHDLVVKEVFRRRIHFKIISKLSVSMTDITFRMEALWLILEQNEREYKGLLRDIYCHALLGATASLLTALNNESAFSDILTTHLQKALRKRAFHFHFSFRQRNNRSIDIKTLKMFISHIYEHCRLELANFSECPPLSFKTPESQRHTPEFKNLLRNCLDIHSVYYEFNQRLMDHLAEDSLQLTEIIALFNEDSQAFCSANHGLKTQQAIAGNALGLLVANLSASVMSLKKGRTYSNAKLSETQLTEIQDQYGIYVSNGCAFRHNRMSYISMIAYFNISMGRPSIPKHSLKAIEPSHHQPQSSRTKKLPTRYPRKTTEYPGYLRGIMNDGELFGLNQNLLYHTLNPSNRTVKKDQMTEPPTLQFDYSSHVIGNVIPLLLKSRYMVILAFQYLHFIDTDPKRCDPEIISLLPDGGGTAIIELDHYCFAVGSGSGNVTIHDSSTAQIIKTFPYHNKHRPGSDWISQFALLPNNRLACGFSGGEVFIWNLETSQCVAILRPSDELNMDIVPHPSIHGLSILHPRKQVPGVWKGGKPQGTATSLLVTKEGNLFVGYGDKTIALWDMRTYRLIKTYVGHDGWPYALLTLPNGQLVSTGEDKRLKVWNKNGCKNTLTLPHLGLFAKIVGEKIIVADHHHSTEIDLQELVDTQFKK